MSAQPPPWLLAELRSQIDRHCSDLRQYYGVKTADALPSVFVVPEDLTDEDRIAVRSVLLVVRPLIELVERAERETSP